MTQVDGFDAVLALRDYLDVFDLIEQKGKFVARQLLVVYDHRRERHLLLYSVPKKV